MLLRHGLGFGPEAEAVERAIEDALVAGRTADIAGPDKKVRSCSAMTRAIVERVQAG